MDLFEKIAEERIREAAKEGAFDNLSGKGKPFEFENDDFVPEDLRLAWKILKNSGCVPPEVELRREVFSLRQLLHAAVDKEDRMELQRQINRVLLKMDLLKTC